MGNVGARLYSQGFILFKLPATPPLMTFTFFIAGAFAAELGRWVANFSTPLPACREEHEAATLEALGNPLPRFLPASRSGCKVCITSIQSWLLGGHRDRKLLPMFQCSRLHVPHGQPLPLPSGAETSDRGQIQGRQAGSFLGCVTRTSGFWAFSQ